MFIRRVPIRSVERSAAVPSGLTRRCLLAHVGMAAAAMWRGKSAYALDGAERPLLTDVPLDRLATQLESLVPEAMARHKVPGLSLALLHQGKTVWARGFGVRDLKTAAPVDDGTVFEAASLTKPMLAYAALALCEEGKFSLDEPLAKRLPQPYVEENPEFLREVTARHVLTHSTGLPNWRAPGGKLTFSSRPGRRFGYSGEGFVYLQRVVEQIVGQPLDQYLQDTLFKPLNMTSASLVWKDAFNDNFALGYPATGNGQGLRYQWKQPNAASSLVCTPSDYATFMAALLAPPASGEHTLRQPAVAQMLKPQIEATKDVSWGLGVGLEHTPAGDAFWHWGSNFSRYQCFMVAFPAHRIGVVAFTNSGAGTKACAEIVPAAIGGDHPAFRWKKVLG